MRRVCRKLRERRMIAKGCFDEQPELMRAANCIHGIAPPIDYFFKLPCAYPLTLLLTFVSYE
jgi:hypothetical protein